MLAALGATAALALILVNHQSAVFSGKGSNMAPILIVSGAFIGVAGLAMLLPGLARGMTRQGATMCYLVVGLLECLALVGTVSSLL